MNAVNLAGPPEILPILRIVNARRRGSSRPVRVETARGPHLVKLRGAGQGTGPRRATRT